jgi:hypothetical protein
VRRARPGLGRAGVELAVDLNDDLGDVDRAAQQARISKRKAVVERSEPGPGKQHAPTYSADPTSGPRGDTATRNRPNCLCGELHDGHEEQSCWRSAGGEGKRPPGVGCLGWWAWQVLNLRPLPCEEGTSLLGEVGNALSCTVARITCLAGTRFRAE